MRTLALLLLLATPLLAQEKPSNTPVFILQAESATITPTPDTTQAFLTLHHVNHTVPIIYCAPTKRVRAEKLDTFLSVWAAGDKLQYATDPPDAQLFHYNNNEGRYDRLFVELLNIEYEIEKGDITFIVRSLSGDTFTKANLEAATLFVDCYPFCI